MPSQKLPPLSSLLAFEAAARHRSFTAGAAELGLTQTAVSHHVRNLENHLQASLFVREGRAVRLTPAGEILFKAANGGFQLIGEAVGKIAPARGSNELVVSLMPQFSALWAIYRLGEFQKKHPSINVRLHHGREVIDFERDKIDLGVRWGPDTRPGLMSDDLYGLSFAPIASAAIAAELGPDITPDVIARQRLLHVGGAQVNGSFNWEHWLRTAGAKEIPIDSTLIVDEYIVLINAMLDSQGIGLCPTLWVADLLKEGKLKQLSDVTLESDEKYYLVYPKNRQYQAKIRLFRDWITEKARAPFK